MKNQEIYILNVGKLEDVQKKMGLRYMGIESSSLCVCLDSYMYTRLMRHPKNPLGMREGQEGSTAPASEAICVVLRDEKFGAQEYEASKENEWRLRDLDARKDC